MWIIDTFWFCFFSMIRVFSAYTFAWRFFGILAIFNFMKKDISITVNVIVGIESSIFLNRTDGVLIAVTFTQCSFWTTIRSDFPFLVHLRTISNDFMKFVFINKKQRKFDITWNFSVMIMKFPSVISWRMKIFIHKSDFFWSSTFRQRIRWPCFILYIKVDE